MKTVSKNKTCKYRLFADARSVTCSARFNQPVLLTSLGEITLEKWSLGVWFSPYYLSGYIHIVARNPEAEIIIGDGVFINNYAVIIADRTKISIGRNTLIDTEFTVYDS
jgi:acetyltransferase-like isoleucine patch superfamily enzyme